MSTTVHRRARGFAVVATAAALLLEPGVRAAHTNPGVLATIAIADFPQFLAVNSVTNRIYVNHAGSNTISVIDGATFTVIDTIPLGDGVTGIAVNSTTNRVYASSFFQNKIHVIDGATDAIVDQVDVSQAAIGFGGGVPLHLAVDADRNRVYAALGNGSIAVIDGATDTVVSKVFTGGTPTGLAVNTKTNRIYASDQSFSRVLVLDGNTNILADPIPVLQPAGGAVVSVNEVGNRAYVISRDGQFVTVIDGATNTVSDTIAGDLFAGTAFNDNTDRLYVTNSRRALIDVYDGTTDALLASVPVSGTPLGIGVDPLSDRVYAAALAITGRGVLFVIGTQADAISPQISVLVNPQELWPPDHRLVPVDVSVIASDDSGAVEIRLLSITSNEADDGLGDGDTANDIQGADVGTDDRSFLLRAERSNRGTGRIYTIMYQATDPSGNTAIGSTIVSVPLSQILLGAPTIGLEITGECGRTRLISVYASINNGIVEASNRAFYALRTVVAFTQDGARVAVVEAFASPTNPLISTVLVPFDVSGVVDVTASITLLLIDYRGNEHVVSSQVATAQALDVREHPLHAIYRSVKLEDMQTDMGRTSYARGEEIRGTYKLVNRSERTLCIPSNIHFPQFHTVGSEQNWILRLGSDSDIPSIPSFVFRDSAGRYGAGGQILVTDSDFTNHLWPPAASVTRLWILVFDTTDFPIGQYRFFTEYRRDEGAEMTPVIEQASVDLEIN